MRSWSEKTQLPARTLVGWIGIARAKYYQWKDRYGMVNEHNALVPRDHWLEEWEKQAIVNFHFEHPLEGYRRLTYMMMDADLVAVSPTSVYRVLKAAGLLGRWNRRASTKGAGFAQPVGAHEHWHVDVAHVNICGTFYYLCSILDGFSRYIVHWEIRESMTAADVEIILQRARERFPDARPRIISDNGPQFIARDFKEFIRLAGMTHVRTSPYYPQSNGKLERYHRTIKADGIRPNTPLSPDDARRIVSNFVTHYNEVRLHSAIGYLTPADKLAGRAQAILAARDAKLAAARAARKARRQERRTPCRRDAAGAGAARHRLGIGGSAEGGPGGMLPASRTSAYTCRPQQPVDPNAIDRDNQPPEDQPAGLLNAPGRMSNSR